MWFWFAVAAALLWGGADLFYKLASGRNTEYSHLKIVVAVGVLMGLHAFIHISVSGVTYDPLNLIRYFPVSALYILSMTVGYLGLRYIELSVSSPIGNSSGAVAFILCFLLLGYETSVLQFIAAGVASAGVLALSVLEKQRHAGRLHKKEDEMYRFGAAAIIFPVLYCVIDGLGTFADAVVLSGFMDDEQALLSYEFTFLTAAIIAAFYLVFIKKTRVAALFAKDRAAAGILETAGQLFYIRAMAENAVLTAPLVACYCVISVLLSRVFLKEKLSKAQYAVIIAIILAIAVLGVE